MMDDQQQPASQAQDDSTSTNEKTNTAKGTGKEKSDSWIAKLAEKLTSPMAFVILAAWISFNNLIQYYGEMAKSNDPKKDYVTYAVLLLAAVMIYSIFRLTNITALKEKRAVLKEGITPSQK